MIRCSKPTTTDLEKQYVNDCLEKCDIGVGEYVEKFEQSWSSWNNKAYGVACNSGTNAIYLALKALGIGPGDEVLVPEYTMVATAWAVSYTGATPVFIDCEDDLNTKASAIQPAITPKTKAIIVVPIYGRAVSSAVYYYAQKHNLLVIEDMAEAHGIIPIGDIACYSFYGNKILATGEGGMCLTDNKAWADEMRSLANMYFDPGRTMIHPKMGHNFRMTNLQAAIGCAQVERATDILQKRKQIEAWYDALIPEDMKMPERDVVWMYDIDCGDRQEEIKQKLSDSGIESRYGFKPMSMQPMYLGDYEQLNAYKWSKRILYLPTYPDLTEESIKTICQALNA